MVKRNIVVSLAVCLVLILMVLPVGAQTNTPTPTPTGTPLAPEQNAFDYMATAAARLTETELTVSDGQIYRNGEALLPEFDFQPVFGYVKWVFIGDMRRLFGVFAPVVSHFRVLLILAVMWIPFYYLMKTSTMLILSGIWLIRMTTLLIRNTNILQNMRGVLDWIGNGINAIKRFWGA